MVRDRDKQVTIQLLQKVKLKLHQGNASVLFSFRPPKVFSLPLNLLTAWDPHYQFSSPSDISLIGTGRSFANQTTNDKG